MSEADRGAMVAECLTLVFEPSAQLVETIDSVAEVMERAGDPLKKIWIEDHNGCPHTLALAEAREWLRTQPDFRTFQVIPKSETGNQKSTWLSAAMAFNITADRKTLFFGLPQLQSNDRPFGLQMELLRNLVATKRGTPVYGFGFHRPYALGPAYFSMGNVFKAHGREVEQVDWLRMKVWSTELSGTPEKFPKRFRHAKGMILDVFPLNVLNDLHLRKLVEGVELREWIERNTGKDSLVQVGNHCFAWIVPPAQILHSSTRLQEAGLIMAVEGKRLH